MKKSILILLSIVSFIVTANSQENISEQIKAVEEGLLPTNFFEGESTYSLTERMKYYNVPGLSITVVKDFKILWTKHYGVIDYELNTPVTDNTLFSVGSLSKGLAALTVLSLAEEGLIDINEDVNTYLKSWKVPENEFTKKAKVTTALLMNHSGGVMHHYGREFTRDNFPSITQCLNGESPSNHKPTVIDRVPGKEFLYSNPGYAILQQLVEDVTGRPFHEVAYDNVLSKIGLSSSTFEQPLPLQLEKLASYGHRNGKPIPHKYSYFANLAAGGFWTTSSDYAKYVIELQKSYHGKSNKIISEELTKEMLKPHVSKTYGYGVFMRPTKNELYFGHMGDNSGFFAGFLSHISDGNAVVILTNSRNSAQLIREINRAVAYVYSWKDMSPETIKIADTDPEKLKVFSGRYKVGKDESLDIYLKDNELYIKNYSDSKLFHTGNDVFKLKNRGGEIQFIIGKSGIQAEFIFTDELGRYLNKKKHVWKMDQYEKLPSEYLDEGNFKEAKEAYRKIFINDSNNRYISEMRLNSLGYYYIGKKEYNKALCIFELNVEFYPNSANVYDSYAEALMFTGKKQESIRNYKKVLELEPNSPNAKAMIKKLESE